MRYYRHSSASGLIARRGDALYDLGESDDAIGSFLALARAAADRGDAIDAVAESAIDTASGLDATASDIDSADPDFDDRVRVPLTATEVWAAGVTYRISQEAREAESSMPEMYLNVYDAERPEIFFKATPSRTVGPGEGTGIRADSDWDVPEPELAIVLHRGEIVGYTIGNDMSSRDIEGQNPLYLPQAKVYERCCAIGPCVVSPETVGDPHELAMSVEIERDGETVFSDATTTGEMVRTVEELTGYLTRHNTVPELTVLLTGTSLVPPDEFTLHEGDVVSIEVEHIGRLRNPVVEV